MTDRESTSELGQRPIAQPLIGPLAAELRAGLAHTSQNIERGAPLALGHPAIPIRTGALPPRATLAGTSNSGLCCGELQVELLLPLRSCRRDRRGPRRQAHPFQISTDGARVGDGGNDLHAASTGGAFGHVNAHTLARSTAQASLCRRWAGVGSPSLVLSGDISTSSFTSSFGPDTICARSTAFGASTPW